MFTDFGDDFKERFHIVRRLGRGAFGVVYEAKQKSLDRLVAIKYQIERSSNQGQAKARFLREADILKDINHERIVRLYDAGFDGDIPYIVEEYLDGSPLDELLDDDGCLPLEEALLYTEQVAIGMAEAHRAGIFHRDLKPANIFIVKDKGAKILDFGLGKMEGRSATLTKTGQIVGTPAYAAPEQLHGLRPSASMDIYALGTMLWVFLVGEPPFPARKPNDLFRKMSESPETIRKLLTFLPVDLTSFVDACVAHDVKDRPQSMDEIVEIVQALRLKKELPQWWQERLRKGSAATLRETQPVAIDSKPTASVDPVKKGEQSYALRAAAGPPPPSPSSESTPPPPPKTIRLAALLTLLVVCAVLFLAFFHQRGTKGSATGNQRTKTLAQKLTLRKEKIAPTQATFSITSSVPTTATLELVEVEKGEVISSQKLHDDRNWKITLAPLKTKTDYKVRLMVRTKEGPLRRELSFKTPATRFVSVLKRFAITKQQEVNMNLTSYIEGARCSTAYGLYEGKLIYGVQGYGLFSVDVAQRKLLREDRKITKLRCLRHVNGAIFTVNEEGIACCRNVSDYALRWEKRLDGKSMYGLFVDDERMYSWVIGKGLRVLSTKDGKLLWQYDNGAKNASAIIWNLTDEVMWVYVDEKTIKGLAAANGRELPTMKFALDVKIRMRPSQVGDRYYVSTYDGRIIGGKQGALQDEVIEVAPHCRGWVTHLTSDERYLYGIRRRPGTIFAYDTVAKKQKWQLAVQKRLVTNIVMHNGRLYFCDADKARYLYCVDANTGDVLWSKSTDLKGSFGIIPTERGICYCSGVFLELIEAQDL